MLLNAYLIFKLLGWIGRFTVRCLASPIDVLNWVQNGARVKTSEDVLNVLGMFARLLMGVLMYGVVLAAIFHI